MSDPGDVYRQTAAAAGIYDSRIPQPPPSIGDSSMSEQQQPAVQEDNGRYTAKLGLEVFRQGDATGQGGKQLMTSTVEYNNMRYADIVMIEGMLVDMMQKLNQVGVAAAIAKGQGDRILSAKAALEQEGQPSLPSSSQPGAQPQRF